MQIVTWSPLDLTPQQAEELGVGYLNSPEEVAAVADAVTIHVALTPETKHLVGKKFLDAMKPGAILINTSRGPLVDAAALKAAIAEKKLRVGMDVFEGEPAGGEAEFADKELAAMVTCTPHIGASTDQAADAIAAEVVRIVKVFLKTGHSGRARVNLATRSPATHRLVVRHLNRVGVLAFVLDGLREEGVNVEEMREHHFRRRQGGLLFAALGQAPHGRIGRVAPGQREYLERDTQPVRIEAISASVGYCNIHNL